MYIKLVDILAKMAVGLPSEYGLANYIQFTGGAITDSMTTQIHSIKTNLTFGNIAEFSLDVLFYQLQPNFVYCMSGFGDGPQIGINWQGKWHNYATSDVYVNLNELYHVVNLIDHDAEKTKLLVNGTQIIESTFSSPRSPMCFGGIAGSNYLINNIGYQRIYGGSYKTTLGTMSTIIPCYRINDMRAGLWDTLVGVFYTTNGSNPTVTFG